MFGTFYRVVCINACQVENFEHLQHCRDVQASHPKFCTNLKKEMFEEKKGKKRNCLENAFKQSKQS